MEAFYQAVAEGAEFGFPSVAFKAAAVSAGFRTGVTKNKTIPNSAFHINGDMVRIYGTPEIREDMVRVGMGAADLRYRGEFKEWSVILPIRFNTAVFTHEQIINLFNLGGFACGIGEWRPERGGSFGMYPPGGWGGFLSRKSHPAGKQEIYSPSFCSGGGAMG